MRLRLRVQRNELPTVSTLWPISDTQLKHTISQLLKHVNQTFPLESETWGLEHYTVTVRGYECLHYHELGAVCKDEDEVVIRPLQYAETRARTLTGREQITPDGRHLVDGLPFGRPLLRGVVRPDVRIPPRKRRRPEEAPSGGAAGDADELALVQITDEDVSLDEDEEDDVDFEDEVSGSSSEDTSSDEDSSDSTSDTSDTSSTSDSESDDDESMSEASWNGIKSGPPTPPSKKAASETALGLRMNLIGPQAKDSTGTSKLHTATQSSAVKRKAPSEDSEQGHADQAPKKVKRDSAPPFQGKAVTQARNARKRDMKKLAHLKRVGVLHADATLTTFHEWQEGNKQRKQQPVEVETEQDMSEPLLETGDEQVDGVAEKDTLTDTLDHVAVAEDRSTPKPADDGQVDEDQRRKAKQVHIEKQRQELLNAISSGGVDVTDKGTKRKLAEAEDDDPPDEVSTKRPAAGVAEAREQVAPSEDTANMPAKTAVKPASTKSTDMVPSSVKRRSKLDLAGSQRLLFGSLGVRAPKTQQEKDALQKELADKAKQRVTPAAKGGAEAAAAEKAAQVEHEDDKSWRDKIELTAVECCDEGVTLSTPPFPFYQRWDPQQRKKKSKGRTGKAYAMPQKLRKKGRHDDVANGDHVESYDKYNTNGGGDALDYDDAAEEEDEEYWEEGALLDESYDGDGAEDGAAKQLQRETAEQGALDEGFPPLPDNVADLSLLAEKDAQKDDIVIYTELTCSAATNWQPSMLTRTAQLLGKDEDGWSIKLAVRDMRAKEYDGEGKRIYKKFEMEGLSDDEDEEEERVKTAQWAELLEPRLLLRPEAAEAGGTRTAT